MKQKKTKTQNQFSADDNKEDDKEVAVEADFEGSGDVFVTGMFEDLTLSNATIESIESVVAPTLVSTTTAEASTTEASTATTAKTTTDFVPTTAFVTSTTSAWAPSTTTEGFYIYIKIYF